MILQTSQMSPVSENEELQASKPYSCFICNKYSSDKGLPLLMSETTYSRICLGEKLQEILGKRLVLLIGHKDAICWTCATRINRFDKFEHELDIIKDYIFNAILVKYNCNVEDINRILEEETNNANIEEESLQTLSEYAELPREEMLQSDAGNAVPKAKEKPEKPLKVRFDPQVKIKADKENSKNASINEVLQTENPSNSNEFQCHICLHFFETFDIFEKHVKLHNLAKSRFYKCKVCDFSSPNLEAYCRHLCNLNTNKYISCKQCKRNFIGVNQSESDHFVCLQCVIKNKEKNGGNSASNKRGTVNSAESGNVSSKFGDNGIRGNVQKSSGTHLSSFTSKHVKPKTQLVRKLTTEGSIEYEEEDFSEDQMNEVSREVTMIDQSSSHPGSHFMDVEGDEGTSEYTFEHAKPNQQAMIKTELEEDQVKEIIVPDHLLEQISNKTGRNPPYMLKCSNCEEVLDVRELPVHRCFLELEAVEFFEVENALEIDMGMSKKEPLEDGDQYSYVDQDGYYHQDGEIVGDEETDAKYQPRLLCKTCFEQFPSIVQLREHWQDTGHAWEVGTVNIDVKTIKDKVKNNERTFKVVKQMFSMKANLPMQPNVIESDYTDEHMFNIKNMFVKVRANNECETCGKLFPTEDAMKDHMVDECLTCVYCNIRFLSNSLLKKHYQCTGHWRKIVRDQDPSVKVADALPLICPMCDKSFFSRYSLGTHLKTHYKGTSKGACHYCFKEFEDESKINDHVVEVHNAQLYKCKHCEKTFLSEWKKDKHQALKHKNECFECRLCSLKFKSLKILLRHNEQFHREKACRICGKYINSWQSLKRHEKRHFYEQGLQCTLCQKMFRNKTALKVHNANYHKGEFKYYCDHCESGFMNVESLEEHRIVHFKKKNECSKCGKKCPTRTAFWMHKKMHDGPYNCNVCGRIFRDTSLLAIHRRKHLRARPYQCPHCPRMFSVAGTLRRHLPKHTRAYPYRCALCRRGFISRYSYHRHLETLHNVRQSEAPSKPSSLPLNPTDEDIFQAADTLISDDSVMLNGYPREESSQLITEVVVETTELFDEILS